MGVVKLEDVLHEVQELQRTHFILVLGAWTLDELLYGIKTHEDFHLRLVVKEHRVWFEAFSRVNPEKFSDF
jgi:hypothetical protein